ncbi:MAG TPA: hypothetical protein VKU83_08190, partial [Puia sp.]|nr:hypothetical protein [Puia sp.]
MNHLYRSLLLAVLLFPLALHAQQLDSMLNIYANDYAQEKVYLQLDKQAYRPGETVWFKAYIFSGAGPSAMSHNFYAELSDPSGTILQRKVYPVIESSAAGNFDLPKGISYPYLHIRAYTAWMTNFDSAFYYEKDLRLDDGKVDRARAAGLAPVQTRMQFFPEGGERVAGVGTTVAFLVDDQFGRPVVADGVIENRDGNQVLGFASAHDGMGKFVLPADAGDSLTAVWKDEEGAAHRTPLPAARRSGIVLRAEPANQKVLFSVTRSAGSDSRLRRLTIIGHMHQHPVYQARISLEDHAESGGTIPTGTLPSGVLVLTVFDANMMPLAERAVFVNNHDYLFSPRLSVQDKGVTRRSKNTLVIDVPDTVTSNLSIAVTDASADGEFRY